MTSEERQIAARDANVITDTGTWLIRDRWTQDLPSIVSAIRYEHAKDPLGLVVIDYLNLIKRPLDDDVKGLGEICRALKMLAGELGLPILLLHQMNRKNEDRPSSPRLSDLRGSGEIEEHADAVAFVSWPWKIEKENTPAGQAVDDSTKEEFFVQVRKNRGNVTGDTMIYFFAETMTMAACEKWREEPWKDW